MTETPAEWNAGGRIQADDIFSAPKSNLSGFLYNHPDAFLPFLSGDQTSDQINEISTALRLHS